MSGVIKRAMERSKQMRRQVWVCRDRRGRIHYLAAYRRGTTMIGRAIGDEWLEVAP